MKLFRTETFLETHLLSNPNPIIKWLHLQVTNYIEIQTIILLSLAVSFCFKPYIKKQIVSPRPLLIKFVQSNNRRSYSSTTIRGEKLKKQTLHLCYYAGQVRSKRRINWSIFDNCYRSSLSFFSTVFSHSFHFLSSSFFPHYLPNTLQSSYMGNLIVAKWYQEATTRPGGKDKNFKELYQWIELELNVTLYH